MNGLKNDQFTKNYIELISPLLFHKHSFLKTTWKCVNCLISCDLIHSEIIVNSFLIGSVTIKIKLT